MIIGYLREANINIDYRKQLAQLQQKNCTEIVVETGHSNQQDEQLDRLVHRLKEGDKLVVVKLAVLADSIRSLAELLEKIHQKVFSFNRLMKKSIRVKRRNMICLM